MCMPLHDDRCLVLDLTVFSLVASAFVDVLSDKFDDNVSVDAVI